MLLDCSIDPRTKLVAIMMLVTSNDPPNLRLGMVERRFASLSTIHTYLDHNGYQGSINAYGPQNPILHVDFKKSWTLSDFTLNLQSLAVDALRISNYHNILFMAKHM